MKEVVCSCSLFVSESSGEVEGEALKSKKAETVFTADGKNCC